jgi:hypothetical protein
VRDPSLNMGNMGDRIEPPIYNTTHAKKRPGTDQGIRCAYCLPSEATSPSTISSSLKVEAPQIGNRLCDFFFIIKKGALFCILHMGPQIIGTALPCAVFIVHKEMRNTSFWLSLKTKVDGLSVVCLQNHGDDFSRFGLKTGGSGFLI